MTVCSVAVALVLLMDVSGSVEPEEYDLQKNGTAQAFRSPELARIIGNQDGVAVTAIEWSTVSRTTVPWTILRTARDAVDFGEALRRTQALPGFPVNTHMGQALASAQDALEQLPCDAEREVIDVSGDGQSDTPITAERDALMLRGVTINALVVPDKSELPGWFREYVVTPGGFLIEATGYAEFGPAIRRKIQLELAGMMP